MNISRNKKSGWLGSAALGLLVGAGVATPAALAQEVEAAAEEIADEEAAEEEGTIVVVGSRIRRDNFTSPSPVQLITREESTRAGFGNVIDLLQDSTSTGGTDQDNQLNGGFVIDGGPGVNTLGLRGFGPTSTAVLLNGRRLTPAGTRGSVGAADLNTIPTALVDHVEILKDGASSIYGSDAVAGVVNIVTRQDYDGFTLEGQFNGTEHGGGDQTRLSLSGGHRFGNLSLGGSIEYFERQELRLADRDWAACSADLIRDPVTGDRLDDIDPLTGEIKCYGITHTGSNGVTINTIGTSVRAGVPGPGAVGGSFNRWRPNPAVTGGGVLDGFEGVNGGGQGFANRDTFDPRMLLEPIFTPTENFNAFFQGALEIPGGHELYGEFLYSNRQSSATSFRQLSVDYANSPLLPAELQVGGNFQTASSLPNPPPMNVPLPDPFSVRVRLFSGPGTTQNSQDVDYFRTVFGVRGDLGFEGWRYDFNVYHGVNNAEYVTDAYLTDRIFNSVVVVPAPVGTPSELVRNVGGTDYMCEITATNPAYGCVPAPELTAATVAGIFPDDWHSWVRQPDVGNTEYSETALSFIVDGPLFQTPGGEAMGAFGGEYRTAEINDVPGFNAVNRNLKDLSAGAVTTGSDNVFEVFGEVDVPLLSDAPFARSLALNVSGRYTDYASYGEGTTHKFGLTWEPVDGLTIRATQGTSYRAPALFEQFLGPTTGFLSSGFDPCDDYGLLPVTSQRYINCHAELNDTSFFATSGVTITSAGGAAQGLEAETSENFTIGFTANPLRDVDGLGELWIALDRFSIQVDNQVVRVGGANLLALCYDSIDFRLAEPYCSYSFRDFADNNKVYVDDNFTNISSQVAEGWDFGARYERSLFGGVVNVVANVTQFTEQSRQILPTSGVDQFNGQIGAPEYSGDLTFGFEAGPWYLRFGTTWIGAMDDYAAFGEDPATSVWVLSTDDYYLHNASVQYDADSWQLTAGVRNLFDEDPPRVSALEQRIGESPYFSGFDYAGRQFFVNLSSRF